MGAAEARIAVAGDIEALAIVALDAKDDHGAVAGFHHFYQFIQMLGTALRHAVGKLGQTRLPGKVHVLDLDIGIGQEGVAAGIKIDARIMAVLFLRLDSCIA